MTTLPSSRTFLSSLVSSISSTQHPPPPTPTASPIDAHRDALATLHLLFPNQLLPALDLIDNRLLIRLQPADSPTVASSSAQPIDPTSSRPLPRFLVTYAPLSKKRRKETPLSGDIVSLSAWSCTCAAFTYDVFVATGDVNERGAVPMMAAQRGGDTGPVLSNGDVLLLGDVFGGLAKETIPPCCKHLLACLLVERCGLGRENITTKLVTREQLAGCIFEL